MHVLRSLTRGHASTVHCKCRAARSICAKARRIGSTVTPLTKQAATGAKLKHKHALLSHPGARRRANII